MSHPVGPGGHAPAPGQQVLHRPTLPSGHPTAAGQPGAASGIIGDAAASRQLPGHPYGTRAPPAQARPPGAPLPTAAAQRGAPVPVAAQPKAAVPLPNPAAPRPPVPGVATAPSAQAPAPPPAPPPLPDNVTAHNVKSGHDAVTAASAALRTSFAMPVLEHVSSVRRVKKLAKLLDPSVQMTSEAAAFIDDIAAHFIEEAVGFAAEAAKLRAGIVVDTGPFSQLEGANAKRPHPVLDAYDLALYCKEVFPFLSLPLPPFNKNRPLPAWTASHHPVTTGLTIASQPKPAVAPAIGAPRPASVPVRPHTAAAAPRPVAGTKRKGEVAPQGPPAKKAAP